jgi:hypothetical protein
LLGRVPKTIIISKEIPIDVQVLNLSFTSVLQSCKVCPNLNRIQLAPLAFMYINCALLSTELFVNSYAQGVQDNNLSIPMFIKTIISNICRLRRDNIDWYRYDVSGCTTQETLDVFLQK